VMQCKVANLSATTRNSVRQLLRLSIALVFVWTGFRTNDLSADTRPPDAAVSQKVAENATGAIQDNICGPRCVHYILHSFSKDSGIGLLELVDKLQPNGIKEGARLADIDTLLQSYGIFTAAGRVNRNSAIVWPYPVLMHLTTEAKSMGHYVLILPGSTRTAAIVWDGLSGVSKVPTSQLSAQLGGGVLLTSPVPIADPASAVVGRPAGIAWDVGRFFAVAAIVMAGWKCFETVQIRRQT